MATPHPLTCACRCHADPAEKRMEVIALQQDDSYHQRCFSRASLQGFNNPNGLRCRDCGQYYGYHPVTNELRPIEGNPTFGPHPGSIAAGRLAPVANLGWRVTNWLTPNSAPVWFQEKIRDGVQPPVWQIVTRWTMD